MSAIIPLKLQVVSAASIFILLVWIVALVRTNRLSLRDSLLWILSTCAALGCALFPGILAAIARLLGIAVPVNAAFAIGFLYVLTNLVSNTLKSSSSLVTLRRVVQEVGILRAELEGLKGRDTSEK